MYSEEDLQRDIRCGRMVIRDVARNNVNLEALAEEFISECEHPDGRAYWKQVLRVANHNQDKYLLLLINHFTEWAMSILELSVVPWPVTPSRGPALRRKYDTTELEALNAS